MADDIGSAASSNFDTTQNIVAGLDDTANTIVSRSVSLPIAAASKQPPVNFDSAAPPDSPPDVSSPPPAVSSPPAETPSDVPSASPPKRKFHLSPWIVWAIALGGLMMLGFLVYKLASREPPNVDVNVTPDIHVSPATCACTAGSSQTTTTTPSPPSLPSPPPPSSNPVGPPPGYLPVAPPPMAMPGTPGKLKEETTSTDCAVVPTNNAGGPPPSSSVASSAAAIPSAFSARVAKGKDAPKYVKSGTGFEYSTAAAAPIRPSWAPASQTPRPFQPNATYAEFTQGSL